MTFVRILHFSVFQFAILKFLEIAENFLEMLTSYDNQACVLLATNNTYSG